MPRFGIPMRIPLQGMPTFGIQTRQFLASKRANFVAGKLATGFAVRSLLLFIFISNA